MILKLQLQNQNNPRVAAGKFCSAALAVSFAFCHLPAGIAASSVAAASVTGSSAEKAPVKSRRASKNTGKNNKDKAAPSAPKAPESILLDSMRKELDRSMSKLKTAGEAPLYFLSYAVYDTESLTLQSDYGGSYNQESNDHKRQLDIDLRVGDPKVDNTHKLRSSGFSFDFSDLPGGLQPFPIEDDAAAIRTSLWLRTDNAYKQAQNKYRKVKTNRNVKVEEDDTSDDFSLETPHQENGKFSDFSVDKSAWDTRLKRLSTLFKQFPEVQDSNITFTASRTKRYLVNSEGTNIQDEQLQYRIMSTVTTTASDGMKIWLYDGIEALSPDELPNDEALEKMVRKLSQDLTTLKTAPRAEPYAGPAILKNKAAGVFFHEIFGHRIEGHRQKDETEGRTFAKKVGQPIMPDFISVSDDPTRQRFGNKPLNGYYKFDDEGVPAEKVSLVDKGILKGFLMSRSPVKDFNKSNGHGRCSPGHEPVARQGNLIIDSSKRVPYEKLRAMLIEEVKKQGKPYGLVFDEIAGGFTMTQTFMPQSFKLLPLRVWRVYTDGRPDELLRGVDLVGTPLASLERIMCAAEDDDTFNGTCGAESGWVPVSATAPSLLVGTIEVELQSKDQDKPPLLPAPLFDKEDKK